MCRNERSILSAYNQFKTYIDWLAPTYLTNETVVPFSNLTSRTASSGGYANGTISTVSKSRSLITNTFDLIKKLFSQNILVTGANRIKSLMSS